MRLHDLANRLQRGTAVFIIVIYNKFIKRAHYYNARVLIYKTQRVVYIKYYILCFDKNFQSIFCIILLTKRLCAVIMKFQLKSRAATDEFAI